MIWESRSKKKAKPEKQNKSNSKKANFYEQQFFPE
jgi:hypothetical protein